jgi:CheY-like chemotaxis protein
MMEMVRNPLRDGSGRLLGVLAIGRDMTERARAEEAVRQAKEIAEEATRMKTNFLANMSHEIRTPMNAIIGMSHLALKTDMTPRQRDYITKVQASGRHLLGIIDDILDFSKVEAGMLDLDPEDFALGEVLGDTMSSLALRGHDKGIEVALHIAPDTPDVVVGDAGRLRQVIVNLVGNAIKFTEQGEVVLRVEMSDGDVVHLSVKDTGIGIPAEKHAAIFDSFAQADASTTRKFGGTGLGLSIATQLTRLMGGRIWVESQPGIGSTFHVAIPFRPAARAGLPVAVDTGVKREGIGSLRVLLAEDNAVNALLASVLLRKAGHHVTHVVTGRQALNALALHQFDVVLMDVQMPDMDGLEATAEIRRAEAGTGDHLPIVVVTAHAMAEDRKRFLDSGADGYLTKPFSPEQLYAVIASLRSLEPALS